MINLQFWNNCRDRGIGWIKSCSLWLIDTRKKTLRKIKESREFIDKIGNWFKSATFSDMTTRPLQRKLYNYKRDWGWLLVPKIATSLLKLMKWTIYHHQEQQDFAEPNLRAKKGSNSTCRFCNVLISVRCLCLITMNWEEWYLTFKGTRR